MRMAMCVVFVSASAGWAQLIGADGDEVLHAIDASSGEIIGGFEIDQPGIGFLETMPDGRLVGADSLIIRTIDLETGQTMYGPCLCAHAVIGADIVFAPDGTGYGYARGMLGSSYLFAFDPEGQRMDSLYTVDGAIEHDIGALAWLEGTGVVSILRSTHEIVRFHGDGEVEVIGGVAGLEGVPIGTAFDGAAWFVTTYVPDTGANLLYAADLHAGTSAFIGEIDGPGVINGIAIIPCAADVNGDGELNVLDFVAFQLAWGAQEPGADCDGDGDWTVLDFVCIQAAFVMGCG